MTKKKTSYQKLKEEKAQLLNDIRTMIKGPVLDSQLIKVRYLVQFNFEEVIWAGGSYNVRPICVKKKKK